MVRYLIALVVIAGLAGLVLFIAPRIPAVQDAVLERGVRTQMGNVGPPIDGLQALICGSASPLAHPTRAQACIAVQAGEDIYIVDTGSGAANSLNLYGVPAGQIAAVLLTHLHSDHISDLGPVNLISWVGGRGAPLAVYGPPGVERVVEGFNEAYALDRSYRTAHHGADFLPVDVGTLSAVIVNAETEPFHRGADGLTIRAFTVDHDPVRPAYGYRFDYRGRSLVVSGDTARTQAMVEAALGADVLLHEAQANHILAVLEENARVPAPRVAKILNDIIDYHTTPIEAASIANEAGVGQLVLYHLVPPPRNALIASVFMRGVDEIRPQGVVLGNDGMRITLPANDTSIDISEP